MANGTGRRAGAAKKAAKKRAPAKRAAAARKATAKKAATKRAPAKKAAPKKTAPKKTASKRAPAKKAAPKKAAKRATPRLAAAPAAPTPAATAVVVDQSPTPPSTPAITTGAVPTAAAPGRSRSLAFRVAGAVLVLAALVLMVTLRAQERGGPSHEWVSIGDGIPGTLYVPYEDDDDGDDGLPAPPPADERPPVIVLAHGYSADQNSVSGLARSFAEAGYATLTFDFRGHGSNTHRFQGELREDFAAAVDWAETSPYVDGDRIAVMGHSMGAGAALDFATLDARPKAVIPLSGGWIVNDGVVPSNTLFLVASGDPGRIHDRQDDLAEDLEAAGGNVVQQEITGVDHTTILRRDETVAATTAFLDPIFDVARADGETPGMEDPRLKTAALYLLVALALIALAGTLVGRVAPSGPASDQTGPVWSGFVLVAGALVLTMPVLSQGQWDLLPLGAGQPIVMHLGLTAALLWGLRALAQRGVLTGPVGSWLADDRPWLSLRTAGWTGLAGAGVVVALLVPLGPVFHRMVPTPQRAVYWVVMAAVALPFFAAFHAIVRRGTGTRSVVTGVLGRLLLLVVLAVGVLAGVLPSVIFLVLPLMILQYVALELFASTCYLGSRNATVVAIVDAVIVGWLAVTFTPVA